MRERMTITREDSVKATAIDINGKVVANIYDILYTSVGSVIREALRRAGHHTVKEIQIYNETREIIAYYTPGGRRL